MEEIKVSVVCLVYNHDKYLRKCLDGFVMQKADFLYEVLIHDDASTDSSAEIIGEYAKRYPEIFRPIYQKENQYSKHVNIYKEFILSEIRGKYVALCEGDDYWCDPCKLQKQYWAMEKNPNCAIALHKVRRIYENGKKSDSCYPTSVVPQGVMTSQAFYELILLKEAYPFQTSSYFFKAKLRAQQFEENPPFAGDLSFGDVPMLLYMALRGDVYYEDCEMSCYRMNSIGSWNDKNGENYNKNLRENQKMLSEFDAYTDYKYTSLIQEAKTRKEFYYMQKTENYRGLLKWRYRKQFFSLGWKEKAFIVLHCLKRNQ